MTTYSNWRYRCNGFVWLWPEAYLEVDGAGVVVEWNPRAEEVFGWRRAEVVGRLAEATLLPGALGEPLALVGRLVVVAKRQDPPRPGTDGNDHVRFQLRHRAGHLVPVEGRLFVTGQNGDRSIGGFITPCGRTAWSGGDDELLRELGLLPAPALPADPELLHDPLTGLPNRTNFERLLADAVAPPDVLSGAVGVVLLDLDRFKSINTSLGYGTGDSVLAMVADRLLGAAGDAVLVARSGGDEFLALFRQPGRRRPRPGLGVRRSGPPCPRPPVRGGRHRGLPRCVHRRGPQYVRRRRRGITDGQRRIGHVPGQETGEEHVRRPTASRCGSSFWTG